MSNGKYSDLMKSFGFQSFLWTQFLGAFNDNIFKYIVSMMAIDMAGGDGSKYAAVAGAVFVLPFLLFSGYSGYLSDVFSKRSVMVVTKCFEILIMVLGYFAVVSGNLTFLLCVLFLLAMHSTFFSPAKYGILPEMLEEKHMSRANGLLEMTTFLAIILGTSLGGWFYASWKHEPGKLNIVLITAAVLGAILSFGIQKVRRSGATKPFKLNPFSEIHKGIRHLWNDRPLWLTVVGLSYFWLLGAFLQLAILLLGKEVMGLPDHKTAILNTFLALGIGLGSLLAGKISGDKIELGLIPLGSIGMGVCAFFLFFACRQSFCMTLAALSFLGLFGGFFAVPLNAFLQERSGKEEKGRIQATNNFLNTVGMLTAFGLIWLFGHKLHLPADKGILIIGLATLLGTVYILRLLPDFFVRFVLWIFTHSIYRVKVVGAENLPQQGPALLVCNHISWVDGLLLGTSTSRFISFMVWKPIYEMKWFHWLFKLTKAIPTSGRTKEEMLQSIENARQRLREGELVCIFAEGGITPTGNLMHFKKGLERIMDGLDAPIIPIQLDRLWGSIFSYKDGRFFTKWPRQIPYPVTVSFGKPLPGDTKAGEVRRTVQELGADAVEHRKTSADILPYRFIKTAKRNWFSLAMADSMGMRLTFGQALTATKLLADWAGVNLPGEEKVGLLLPSSVGGALANTGLSMAGKVPVNLNFTAGKEAMVSAMEQCGIKTLITSQVFLKKIGLEPMEGMVFLEDILRRINGFQKAMAYLELLLLPSILLKWILALNRTKPDDLATVIFSSGSTGVPKGVMLSHYNILSNLEGCEQIFWVTHEDVVLGVLPFFHSFGFMGTLWFPLVAGFGAVYHPNPLDAKSIGELALQYKASILISTPTFFSAYMRKCSPEDFATLRFPVVGAEKLREPLAKEYKEKFGRDLLEGYGCTEMSPVVAVNMPEFEDERNRKATKMKPGTVGYPLPGVAVKVVHPETGESQAIGHEGLLLVKGSNRMMGYLNQPERTAEVFRDGWYVTGDIALIDEEGFIHITDRLSRFSKIGGEMVPHLKVEEAINRLLGQYTCTVTSVPDEQKGEKLVVLYTDPDKKVGDLWAGLSESDLPKLWIPKKENIFFVESLPTLGSGKLDLRKVKQLALELTHA